MHIPKWLIATAGLVVVVLIAALAFFLGRETSRPAAPPTAASSAPQESPAVRDPAPAEPAPPPADTAGAPVLAAPAPASATSSSNATPPSVSAPAPPVDGPQPSAEARARVAAYFKQMDAIQAGGTAGDPQEFANSLVTAAGNGDFSGVDDLVRAATDAERRAAAVQPPSECAEYHRQAVALLGESRTIIAAMRDGLKRNDTDALTSLSTSAQSMKSRAEILAQTEKALRARFGL